MYGYYSKNHYAELADCLPGSPMPTGAFGVFSGQQQPRFPENQFILQEGGQTAACCGYVLNDWELLETSGHESFSRYLLSLPLDTPLWDRLSGTYAAARYDQNTKSLVLTNDLLSKQPLYYWISEGDLLFSTSFFQLCEAVKALGRPLTPDPMGISMMNETGAFWEDFTYVKEIRFLAPYRYIAADPDGIRVITLPFPVLNRQADQKEAIAAIDGLFTKAVRLQYEKNARSGHQQLGSLSGGMDSRALVVRAEQLGYHNDLCFSYAESGSLDMEISRKVAEHYSLPYVFFPMDGGDFLMNREGYTAGNEGQYVYCGATGLLNTVESLDLTPYGLVHTGIGGGEIMGDIIPAEGDDPAGDVHLDVLLTRLHCHDPEGVARLRACRAAYPTFNVFRQLNDLRTNTNFAATISHLLPAASPFLYEPLYAFLMTLPISMKGFRKLYYSWVDQKLKLPYRTTDASLPVTTGTLAERYIRQALRNLQKRRGKKTRYDMNPFDLWFQENSRLSAFLSDTWNTDIAALSNLDPAVLKQLQDAYHAPGVRHRLSVLTSTWALKKLFGNP